MLMRAISMTIDPPTGNMSTGYKLFANDFQILIESDINKINDAIKLTNDDLKNTKF